MPVAVEELINVGEDLRQNRIKLKDVVKTIEEDDPSEDEMNQRTRAILLLDEIKTDFQEEKKNLQKTWWLPHVGTQGKRASKGNYCFQGWNRFKIEGN